MTGSFTFLPTNSLEEKTIGMSWESNLGEPAPQSDVLSITPWPLGQMRGLRHEVTFVGQILHIKSQLDLKTLCDLILSS